MVSKGQRSVFVVCRRGNDSQIAVDILKSLLASMKTDFDGRRDEGASGGDGMTLEADTIESISGIRDITGGLHAWTRRIDPNFPVY